MATVFPHPLAVSAFDYGVPLDKVFDNTGPNNQALYEGTAQPGTATSAGTAKWAIRKFFYDSNNILQGWRWADGEFKFNKDWSLRAGYTYTSF